MTGVQQVGIVILQPQEPVNVPTPPVGSYYLFVNIFDGITYYKDWNRVCKPVANIGPFPAYADDATAGAAGLVAGNLYQTTGTAPNPLNVPGIVMVKQ